MEYFETTKKKNKLKVKDDVDQDYKYFKRELTTELKKIGDNSFLKLEKCMKENGIKFSIDSWGVKNDHQNSRAKILTDNRGTQYASFDLALGADVMIEDRGNDSILINIYDMKIRTDIYISTQIPEDWRPFYCDKLQHFLLSKEAVDGDFSIKEVSSTLHAMNKELEKKQQRKERKRNCKNT